MKKHYLAFTIIVLLTVILFTSCGSNNLKAKEGEPANGFLWENNYSEITITGYQGASNDIKIPEKINGKPVTIIQSNAFSGFKALNSVVIPGTVKTISSAFKNCEGLTKVTMENGVEDISSAFAGCTSLTDVKLPDSVKNLDSAFYGCTSLKEMTVPDSAEELYQAFSGCIALETVNIPTGATELSSTFSACTSLKTVEIPENITSLTHTFSGCTALTTVTVAGNIESMSATFSGCTSLVDVQLEGTVKSLRDTFHDCSGLKVLTIPDGAIEIESAFSGCSSLEELTLPESFHPGDSYYDSDLLSGCVNLKTITASKEMEEHLLKTTTDTKWSLCENTQADWYKNLIDKTSDYKKCSYDSMNAKELTNGDRYGIVHSINEEDIEPYVENAMVDGLTTIQKTYYLAVKVLSFGRGDFAVICATKTQEKFANCASDQSVIINGTEYPVYKYK